MRHSVLALAAALLVAGGPVPALRASPFTLDRVAKIRSRGEALDLEMLTVPGKTTFVVLGGSDPDTEFLLPFVERIVELGTHFALRFVDIDREGEPSPDLESPIAARYRLRPEEIPMVKVYDKRGRLERQGESARRWVQNTARTLPPPEAGKGPVPPAEVAGEVAEITEGNPVDIKQYLHPKKKTIFMFHSPFCPPCNHFRPMLSEMAEEHPDYILRTVNVNRPGVWGIDYRSPVGTQYGIQALPMVWAMNPAGAQLLNPRAAIPTLLREHQLFRSRPPPPPPVEDVAASAQEEVGTAGRGAATPPSAPPAPAPAAPEAPGAPATPPAPDEDPAAPPQADPPPAAPGSP